MSWTKLTDLPEQKLRNPTAEHIIFWEIRDGKIVHQDRPNRNVDIDSFEVLDGSNFIARDNRFIYNAWTTLKAIDRDSFEPLGDSYFKDKSSVYYDFEALIKPLKGNTIKEFMVLGNSYARDEKFGYYGGRVISKCTSPLTLRVASLSGEPSSPFIMDQDHVYYEGGELKGADPQNWELIGSGFSKDKKGIYFGSKKLGGAKPAAWRVLKHPYSVSGQNIYKMGWRLKGADVESFEILKDGSARDKISPWVGKSRAPVKTA